MRFFILIKVFTSLPVNTAKQDLLYFEYSKFQNVCTFQNTQENKKKEKTKNNNETGKDSMIF